MTYQSQTGNFQIVDNFLVFYFDNTKSIYIFAPAFIDQTKASTTKRNIYF